MTRRASSQLTGTRAVNAKKWRALWSRICTERDAVSISSRDVTDLEARFETEEEAEDAGLNLMRQGFAITAGGPNIVSGFPEVIQDQTTGDSTRLEGLD